MKELTEPLLKRKKKTKTVSWVDDTKLRTFHYFELDETERGKCNGVIVLSASVIVQ